MKPKMFVFVALTLAGSTPAFAQDAGPQDAGSPMCAVDADCGEGEVCLNSYCAIMADGGMGSCQSDADCAVGEACIEGACGALGDGGHSSDAGPTPADAGCSSDSDCGESEVCFEGHCEFFDAVDAGPNNGVGGGDAGAGGGDAGGGDDGTGNKPKDDVEDGGCSTAAGSGPSLTLLLLGALLFRRRRSS